MVKEKSNVFSKISLLIVALILVLTSVFSLSSTGVVASSDGISIAKYFQLTYYKDQTILINGQERTDIPLVASSKLTYVYSDTNGQSQSREVDIEEAVINQLNNASDTTKDRIQFDGFSTVDGVDTSKKYTNKTMTLKFYPAGKSEAIEITGIGYTVYTSQENMSGAKQVTEILSRINKILDNILAPLLIVMASVGMVFAIFLGIKLARANNAEEREEAKKRVIYTIVGIAICVALIIIFKLFAQYSISWLGDTNFFELK